MPSGFRSTAALIRQGERLFFVKRPRGGDLSECWELPGGKVDAGEEPEEALARELREELGLEARVGALVARSSFAHRDHHVTLLGYEVDADLSRMVLHEHEQHGFYTIAEALGLRLAPSDASLLRALGTR